MAKKLWGGRFKKPIDKEFFEFQKSIQFDFRLGLYDVLHSVIHIIALKNAGILSAGETQKFFSALGAVKKSIQDKTFIPDRFAEDIHTDIQNRVAKKVGKLALKLHTLRSRNDQVAFDEKLYCHAEVIAILSALNEVIAAFDFLMRKYPSERFIGFTHTQRAQVILFKEYLAAYKAMFERDKTRVQAYGEGLIAYIGSGAIKGTYLTEKYDAAIVECLKSFKKDMSIKIKKAVLPQDHVSDRDFLVEFLSISALIQMHLSRLAEDFILYSTREFNYVDLPEEFCTGSSLMPHKKNADFLELVRGNTGIVYGNLVSLLTIMKGLPLTYNRDMQLDKLPVFSSVDIIKSELKILSGFLKGVKLNAKAVESALQDKSLYATELAEYLVKQGIAFGEAHEAVGKLIRFGEDNDVVLTDLTEAALQKISPYLHKKSIAAVIA